MNKPTAEDVIATISETSSEDVASLTEVLVTQGLPLYYVQFDENDLADVIFGLRKKYGFETYGDIPITDYTLKGIIKAIPAIN